MRGCRMSPVEAALYDSFASKDGKRGYTTTLRHTLLTAAAKFYGYPDMTAALDFVRANWDYDPETQKTFAMPVFAGPAANDKPPSKKPKAAKKKKKAPKKAPKKKAAATPPKMQPIVRKRRAR